MIVTGGRQTDTIINNIIALDLKTLEWQKLKDLPHGVCSHATEIIQDYLYIYSGTDGQQFLDSMYRFNLKNGNLKLLMFRCPPIDKNEKKRTKKGKF